MNETIISGRPPKGKYEVESLGTLVPEHFNSITLTYVASGNGAGEIETVTYKDNGVSVATLTLSYDANDKLETITRT